METLIHVIVILSPPPPSYPPSRYVPPVCSPSPNPPFSTSPSFLDACIDWARGSSSTLISLEVWERRYEGTERVTLIVPSGLTCEKKKSLSFARKSSTLQYSTTDVTSSETDGYRDATLFSFHRGGYGSEMNRSSHGPIYPRRNFWLQYIAGVLLSFFKNSLLVPEISLGRTFAGNGGGLFSMMDLRALPVFLFVFLF